METRACKNCQQSFVIDDADIAYYQKIDVPFPACCPKCRLQRRLAFRNERTLYKRKCDKTGMDIVANLSPNAPVPVYHVDAWHKDDWNPPMFPSYDFSKSFFEQFHNLMKVSPHMNKAVSSNYINSEYINHAGNCKNCYFIFNTEYAEDSMYLKFCDKIRDCVDCTSTLNSELCYECVNVDHGYRLFFSDDCKNCRDSIFLRFCRGVNNSAFCYGLERKEYHIFNQPYSKEEFFAKLRDMKLNTYTGLQAAIQQWNEFSKQFPLKREILLNCENSIGDGLYNCKNARDCYNSTELQDCRYLVNSIRCKDSYDFFSYGEIELGYEYVTGFKSYNVKFGTYVINSDNIEYCDSIYNCHYCFGCSGLKGKSYCILNKQYSKREYEELVPRIIEHMGGSRASAQRERGGLSEGASKSEATERGPELIKKEYGEFFPMEMSYFPYEDTLAQDYFPRQEKVIPPPQGTFSEVETLPDDVNQMDMNTVAQNAYRCPQTNKLFRFQKQELEFYKKMQLPIPRVSFEARYKRRNILVPFPY